jgi:hypothetical protein
MVNPYVYKLEDSTSLSFQGEAGVCGTYPIHPPPPGSCLFGCFHLLWGTAFETLTYGEMDIYRHTCCIPLLLTGVDLPVHMFSCSASTLHYRVTVVLVSAVTCL